MLDRALEARHVSAAACPAAADQWTLATSREDARSA
jgi:hypothetical protein